MAKRVILHAPAKSNWITPGMAAFGTVLIAVTLAMGTLSPHPEGNEQLLLFPYADKLLHFFGWFVLGLASASISRTSQWQVLAWAACTVFGMLTELGQIFIVGRYFEFGDCLADSLGASVACLVVGTEDRPHG